MAVTTWDTGDFEPDDVTVVTDYSDPDPDCSCSSDVWNRTTSGQWKGYKDGGKVYLDWIELVRRWGPVRMADG